MYRYLVLAILGLVSPGADSHSGGLDANGCHTNHKTGEYHCHRPQSAIVHSSTPASRNNLTSTAGRPFKNCAEARAAGAAPVRRGDPGYAPHLDRDNDGVGCE
jgi:hypothetical protein